MTEQPMAHLEEHGLLLLQDATATSLAGLVAGEPIRGSWWGHPKGNDIFRIANELDDSGRVKTAKLVDGKVTFVHERLWPALAAVGRAHEEWQMRGLSAAARALLADVERAPMRTAGTAAKELEQRLLVDAHQVHTESGRHETELRRWEPSKLDVDIEGAKRALEAAADAIGASGRLPWIHRPMSARAKPAKPAKAKPAKAKPAKAKAAKAKPAKAKPAKAK